MTFFRLVLYFMVFSFAGWISETIICSFAEKKFVKRGFLTGPIIPIYGFGGLIVVILLSPLHHSPVLLYIVGVLSVTVFEYFTGWLMETLFHIRLWDYSSHRFQIKGRVWLVSSLFFGFLALFGVYIVFPSISGFMDSLRASTIVIAASIFLFLFLADTVNSVITVISLNTKLQKIAKLIELELSHAAVQRKLRSETNASWSQRRLLSAYPNMKSKRGKGLIDYMRDQIKQSYKKRRDKIKQLEKKHSAISAQIDVLSRETKEMIEEEKKENSVKDET